MEFLLSVTLGAKEKSGRGFWIGKNATTTIHFANMKQQSHIIH